MRSVLFIALLVLLVGCGDGHYHPRPEYFADYEIHKASGSVWRYYKVDIETIRVLYSDPGGWQTISFVYQTDWVTYDNPDSSWDRERKEHRKRIVQKVDSVTAVIKYKRRWRKEQKWGQP